MNSTVTITDLQAGAPAIVKQTEHRGFIPVTRHGRVVAFMVSHDLMEGILETLELQANPELMRLVKADKAGKVKFKPVPDEDEG